MNIWCTKVFPFILCCGNSFFFPANRLNTAQYKPRSWVSGTDVSLTDSWFLFSPHSWFAYVWKRWTENSCAYCVSSCRLGSEQSPFRGWCSGGLRVIGQWGPRQVCPCRSEWGLRCPGVSSLGDALWADCPWVSSRSHASFFFLSLPARSAGSRWAEATAGWDVVNARLDERPLQRAEGGGSARYQAPTAHPVCTGPTAPPMGTHSASPQRSLQKQARAGALLVDVASAVMLSVGKNEKEFSQQISNCVSSNSIGQRFQNPKRQALPERGFHVCRLSEQRPSPVSPRLASSGHSKARRAGEASRAWEKQTWVCTVLSWVPPAEFLSGKWMNEQTRKFDFVVSKESHDNTKAFLVRFVD